ncbi:MAG: hypothetical protein EX285_06080 [Thaumarchaeota archaeon]|nr:hypothetical protein [Nitrososphaerota archaeon]
MTKSQNSDKTQKDEGFDLGERSVTPQDNSKVVCIPKIFHQKYLSGNNRKVRITMNGDTLCMRAVSGDKK